MSSPAGKKVIGRVDNTAPAPTEIVFKDAGGVTHTLAVGEQVIIYSVFVNNRATAKDLSIIHDTDAGSDLDAGEQINVFSFAAAGFGQAFYERGRATAKLTAATQKFLAVASAVGAVDIVVEAEIVNAKS
jgi:hypothetical protein